MKSGKYRLILHIIVMIALTFSSSHAVFSFSNQESRNIVKGNSEFAFNLYSKLKETKGNLFFSPYSISTVLAMVYVGARGQTKEEMSRVLRFPTDNHQLNQAYLELQESLESLRKKGDIELNIANAIWCQKGEHFLKTYLHTLKKYYESGVHLVDFKSNPEVVRNFINSWVEKQTKNRIKNLIPRGILSPFSRLVLTNAIYFKGKWSNEFDKLYTKPSKFFISSSKSIDVPMMFQESKFRMVEFEKFKVIQLPYVGNELSMIILLPRKYDGLGELEGMLKPENYQIWLSSLKRCPETKVRVYLPKFTMTSQFSLSKQLQEMGMKSAFANADFSGINGKRNLFLSSVIHKAFVDVNEEGTEAAAATGAVVSLTSAMPRPVPVFRADHPFFFVIQENSTASILFMGRVINPVLNQ